MESRIGLFYLTDKARFVDEDGFVVNNIHAYITPNELFLFRYYKSYMCLRRKGYIIELFYPEDDEEE